MGKLFEIQNTLSFNKDKLVDGNDFDYVTRTSQNQGILQETGFVNEENINPAGTWSLGLLQMDFFYREKPWYAGQFVRKIVPKIELNKSSILFFTVIFNKQKQNLLSGLVRDVDKAFLTAKIHLPTQNGQIDFAFMENFIVELEERRIQEMEVERIVELEAYLRVTGLSDYILTEEERAVLEAFRSGKISWGGVELLDKQQVKDIEWRVFRMEDVLEWQPQKEIDPLKLDKLKDKNQKLYPFYGQATINNGIISYNQLVEEVLNNKEGKPTILIHSNNQNTIYLESPFYLKDGHGATSVLQSKKLNKLNALYFMSSIKKVILSKYSYNAKATKIELKNTLISLPSLQGKPLYDYMEVFIRAVQKLVIKDVVQYADRKIEASRKVVK